MRTNSPVVRADQELEGFRVRMDLEPHESHLRPTITVVDDDRRVIGFISHPEQVPGVEIILRIGGRTEGSSGGRSVAARQ